MWNIHSKILVYTKKISLIEGDFLICMVARSGIEPPTQGFSGLCSTTELPRHTESVEAL